MKPTQTHSSLGRLLKACTKGDMTARRELYTLFYGYAMGICLRYAHRKEEAEEMVNDGFLKVFNKLDQCKGPEGFKPWMRRIMINGAIDYYRRYRKYRNEIDEESMPEVAVGDDAWQNLRAEELLRLIQALPPTYRLVFNLYVIEGYSHDEISEELNISASTSRANLAKARAKLRTLLTQVDEYTSYG